MRGWLLTFYFQLNSMRAVLCLNSLPTTVSQVPTSLINRLPAFYFACGT